MDGPYPAGRWSPFISRDHFQHLAGGTRYVVARAFVDFDGDTHPAGEEWTFLGSNFAPYDDGLSLFVSLDGTQEWHIRLCWRPQDQGPIIDALAEHVVPA
jgi:hypothetical protein